RTRRLTYASRDAVPYAPEPMSWRRCLLPGPTSPLPPAPLHRTPAHSALSHSTPRGSALPLPPPLPPAPTPPRQGQAVASRCRPGLAPPPAMPLIHSPPDREK